MTHNKNPGAVGALATAALAYASQKRWPIFPLSPCSKVPLLSTAAGGHGVKDATLDPDKINGWWQRYPSANIGIACGDQSGFFVLDVDPRHDGDETLAALEKTHGPLPKTPRQITGGGGEHILFRAVPGLANRSGELGPGLDIKTTGGYIVGPPSIHECGRAYAWNVDLHPLEVPIADAPEWLLAQMVLSASHRRGRTPAAGRVPDDRALSRLVQFVACAQDGQRNAKAFWAACRVGEMVRTGLITAETAAAIIAEAATRAGLDGAEAERTAWSGVNAGLGGVA